MLQDPIANDASGAPIKVGDRVSFTINETFYTGKVVGILSNQVLVDVYGLGKDTGYQRWVWAVKLTVLLR